MSKSAFAVAIVVLNLLNIPAPSSASIRPRRSLPQVREIALRAAEQHAQSPSYWGNMPATLTVERARWHVIGRRVLWFVHVHTDEAFLFPATNLPNDAVGPMPLTTSRVLVQINDSNGRVLSVIPLT